MLLFLVPIICFLGILVGVILKKIAKEEVKFGKFGSRYFVWMERIILLFIILATLRFVDVLWLVVLFAIIGFVLGIFISEYLFLGLALVFGFFLGGEVLLLIAALVFLYGLPFGSVLRKLKWKHSFLAVLFFAPFLLLFFDTNLGIVIGLVNGGCFSYLIRR